MFAENKYSYTTNDSFLDYEFESIGIRGTIRKVARFNLIDADIYNFGFGDLDETTGNISDTVVSNNGDDDMVLMTLASIIYSFTNVYNGFTVFITGTTASRTRRYQMEIGKHWDDIRKVFYLFGLKKEVWEEFKRGENYSAFIAQRKEHT